MNHNRLRAREQRSLGRSALVALALLMLPAVAGAEEAIDQAVTHHERGIELFEASDYRQAARQFETAERLAHSRANIMNLARCHQELGEHTRALEYVSLYLTEPDLPQEARQRAESLRAELRGALSERNAGEAGGGATETQTEGATPPPSAEESDGPNLAGPWAILGSGLALLLTGTILEVVVFAQNDQDNSSSFASYDDYDASRSSSMAMAIAGDVLLGVGGAMAVGGLVWLLVARSRRQSTQARRPLSISVSPQHVGAELRF